MTPPTQSRQQKAFYNRIHQALRSWHSQGVTGQLDDLLLTQQIKSDNPMATPRMRSNQILLQGLTAMKQVDQEGADLLERRFLDQETAEAVGYRRNQSADIIFQRQRAAIKHLADLIWTKEQELVQARLQRIENRLEPASYTRLFGVTEKMAEIRAVLERPGEPWLAALEGMGGIGKTSLANALARELAGSVHFSEIGWISARQRLFHLSGEVESAGRAPLGQAGFVDRIIEQFALAGLTHQADAEKLMGIKDFLKSHPCLVIVDNLETAADHRALVLQLTPLANPSKFLFTTRHSLRDLSGVYILKLESLSPEDGLALIRYEARTRGLPELARAPVEELEPIYAVTGGNPLAIKLVIGQIHSLSLSIVLDRFRTARGKSIEELLAFLHAAAWKTLETDDRQVMRAMLLVAGAGGRLEQIAAAAELSEERAAACLHQLAALSLVTVSGSMHERRYSLHQLTQAFVAGQS